MGRRYDGIIIKSNPVAKEFSKMIHVERDLVGRSLARAFVIGCMLGGFDSFSKNSVVPYNMFLIIQYNQ